MKVVVIKSKEMVSLSSASLPILNINPISLSPSISSPHRYPFNAKPQPLVVLRRIQRPNYSSISKEQENEEQEEEEEEEEQEQQEDDYRVLTAITSMYNNIVILESESAKVLLLDDSGNVHSILYKSKKWTNSYWDDFSSLPAIIPKGAPLAIFGLGGGTVAHQLLHFWPTLVIDGWELDQILVDQARMFFGISQLEIRNNNNNNNNNNDDDSGGGILRVCVGDALSPTANVEGGYAGIIVDLFANAEILPELEVAQTWLEMKKKLMPNGRIMVNCGGAKGDHGAQVQAHGWEVNFTIKALCEAFGAPFVNWKKMPENESGNYMAFTGPLPDFDLWSASVPEKLSSAVKQWRPCQ